MILDALWWLPTKVVGHWMKPVTAMLESLGENANLAIKEYAQNNPSTESRDRE